MATRLLALAAFNASGAPLAGLSPAFVAGSYVSALTGASATAPAITALGAAGGYQVTVDNDHCGMIQWGSTGGGTAASPAYTFVTALNEPTFGLFKASDGSPLGGLAGSIAWDTILDTATGLAPVTTPTFTELGMNTGCYRINNWQPTYFGILNAGNTANPQRLQVLLSEPANTSGPTVGSFTPAVGTQITTTTALGFTVTPGGTPLRSVVVLAYLGASTECIYDGTALQPLYAAGSSVSGTLAAGLTFSLSRAGGWPTTPTLEVIAVDTAGNENT